MEEKEESAPDITLYTSLFFQAFMIFTMVANMKNKE